MTLHASELLDASIRAAYQTAIRGDSSLGNKISLGEIRTIIRRALDIDTVGRKKWRITPHERSDLFKILHRANLTDLARQHLDSWLREQQQGYHWRHLRLLSGAAKRRISQIISNPGNTGKIHFTAKGITYQPSYYHGIANLIESGHIDVYEYQVPDTSDALHKNAPLGLYRSTRDNLYYQGNGRSLLRIQSTIVHESTHAIQDFKNVRMHRRDLEAAAHIAQTVMLLSRARGDAGVLYGRLSECEDAARIVLRQAPNSGWNAAYHKVLEVLKTAYDNDVVDRGQEWYAFFERLLLWLASQ